MEVTALEPEQTTPHIELLCYQSVLRNMTNVVQSEDVAATRLVFEANGPSAEGANTAQGLIDPDGHHLVILAQIRASSSTKAATNSGIPPRFVEPE